MQSPTMSAPPTRIPDSIPAGSTSPILGAAPQPLQCVKCQQTLSQQRYILHDGLPYCIHCYETNYSNTCCECGLLIATDSKDVGFKDKHWHEKCFMCVDCKTNLIDRPFAHRDLGLFCATCYEKNPSICAACDKPFHLGAKKYLYQSKQWHEDCFRCAECTSPIGTSSFIPHQGQPVCITCYHDKFAVKCVKCNGIIDKGGLKYRGTAMHAECFKCGYCNKLLANEQFATKDEKQFCTDCYGQLFAKRCTRCQKPITGLGAEGTRYVSFEGRHWHSACFSCYTCDVSLVGKGFLVHQDNIVCPDCDRNK